MTTSMLRAGLSLAVIGATLALAPGTAGAASCPTVSSTGVVSPAPNGAVSWASCDLTGANLSKANLQGADLDHATFLNVSLAGANLTGAAMQQVLLRHADLTGANLTDVDLSTPTPSSDNSGAILDDVVLTGANLTNVIMTQDLLSAVTSGGVIGTPSTVPTGYRVTGGYVVGPRVRLLGAHLQGLDLHGIQFTSANLDGADLSNAFMPGTGFTLAKLTNVSLVGADLSYASLQDTWITGSDLTGATLTAVHGTSLLGTPAHLPPGWKVMSGYLVGPAADLSGVTINSSTLAGADLAGANLSYAAFRGTSFKGDDLSGANLATSDLTGADLSGATVAGATLTSTVLTGAHLTGLRSGGVTGAPVGVPLVGGYLLAAGVDATGIDLSGLTRSDDLTGVTLTDANLDATDLSSATLTGVRSGGVTGTPAALPASWALRAGYLVGPGANLAGAALAGVDLSGLDLTGADLDGADLTGANLAGTTLTGVTWGTATCADGTPATSHDAGSCLDPLDTLAPTAAMHLLPTFQTVSPFAVSWAGADSGSGLATYSVRVASQPAMGGHLGIWTTWRSGVPSTSWRFTPANGRRYCFRVQATDRAHNVSAWSALRCTIAAFDDRSMKASKGWVGATARGWYRSTYRASRTLGASLTSPSGSVHQVGVVATTCASCGAVDVYVGTRKVGTISLAARTTHNRSTLMLRRFTRAIPGAVRLVVRTSGRLVRLDEVLITA